MDKDKIMLCLSHGLIFLVIVLVCWLMLGGADVPYNGSGADNAGRTLESIGSTQRDTVGRLEQIEGGLGGSIERTERVTGRIEDTQNRLGELQENLRRSADGLGESQQRIAECLAILERVRARPCEDGK